MPLPLAYTRFESYESMRDRIAAKIWYDMGWATAKSIDIADKLVNKIRREAGGEIWTKDFWWGDFFTSKHRTLKDFLVAIYRSSFGIHAKDILRLIKKFRTMSAIEAVNYFIEQHNPALIITKREKFKAFLTAVSNDYASLKLNMQANIQKLKAKKIFSIAELKAKLMLHATPWAVIRLLFLAFGTYISLFTDTEVCIGPIPIGSFGVGSPCSIQELEVAHSNKIVKFRAVGSIFLAHQVGGHDSIKITGKLTGDFRYLALTTLWVLTIMSQGYTKTLEWGDERIQSQDIDKTGMELYMRGGSFSGGPVAKVGKNIVAEKPSYERHITLPVVTEHEIIPNCYIETFSFEETLEGGKDVINYDLMLRTYEEPTDFIADRGRTAFFYGRKDTMTQRCLAYAGNFIYRMFKFWEESTRFDTNKWKTDNYYDVDAADMGFLFGVTLMGALMS